MKQFLLFLALTFILAGCSDKDGTSDSKDSISSVSVDTSIDVTSTKADDYDSNNEQRDYYAYSEIINKPGTATLATTLGKIYSDTLLQIPLQTLTVGEYVIIEKYCGTTTKNFWNEPIYEITYYDSDNHKIKGYVSQSQIACRLDTLESKKIVALTLGYNLSKEKFIGEISLLSQTGKTLSHTNIELDILKEGDAPYSYTYYFSFEERESTGLDGITESFVVSTDYDACGYPGFEYTFLWNGQKLITFPETYAIAEAGQFHQYSYWLFPSDSLGKKGSILKIIEGDQYEDVVGDTQIINNDSTVIEYKWNKYSFISATGDTIVKKSSTHSVPADY